jgi:hypothetical protein
MPYAAIAAILLGAMAAGCLAPTRTRFVRVPQCAVGDGRLSDDLEPMAPAWKSAQGYLDCQRAGRPVTERSGGSGSMSAYLYDVPACAGAMAGTLRHDDVVEEQPPLARCGTTLVAVRKRLARGAESPEVCVDPAYLSDTRPGVFDRGEWLLLEPRSDPRAPAEMAWRQRGRFATLRDCAARRSELLREFERTPERGAGSGRTPTMECACRPAPGS